MNRGRNVGHQLAMALRAAYWAMHRQADAALPPRGVTANQSVLLALRAEHDDVTLFRDLGPARKELKVAGLPQRVGPDSEKGHEEAK